jgi:hypothetical protein
MIESAADRLAVIETCTHMAWHADRREWDALRDVFTDEVRLDHTSLQGGEPALGGSYRLELVRNGPTWRISAVTMAATWASGNQQIMSLAPGPAT